MKTRAELKLKLGAVLVFLLTLTAARAAVVANAEPVPLILISLDGFRWDYCALYPEETSQLRQLAREGISAQKLIPVFPSNTFPNHYTIVTGLYPSHHGIINNEFFDREAGEYFRYNVAASAQKKIWWHGEPIWVTAQRQGRKSASSFWVGSEAEIAGMRPTFWKAYNAAITFESRYEELFTWLALPPAERPAIITFYLEEGNSIGHKFGPESPELRAALKKIDDRVGAIVQRLQTAHIAANLVVVSDHGMTPISPERLILLDDYVSPETVQVDFDGSVAGLRPLEGDTAKLLQALAPLTHATAYRTAELPARFHITETPRSPAVWIVAEEGWEIYFRARVASFQGKFNRADHGYDNAYESMQGILIAHGPAFRSGGATIAAVENIHLYNLLCATLRLKPAPNDGDSRLVQAFLR